MIPSRKIYRSLRSDPGGRLIVLELHEMLCWRVTSLGSGADESRACHLHAGSRVLTTRGRPGRQHGLNTPPIAPV